MRQLVSKGILVRKDCKECPDFRQPSNYVRPDNGVCIECKVPSSIEIGRWTAKYYDPT